MVGSTGKLSTSCDARSSRFDVSDDSCAIAVDWRRWWWWRIERSCSRRARSGAGDDWSSWSGTEFCQQQNKNDLQVRNLRGWLGDGAWAVGDGKGGGLGQGKLLLLQINSRVNKTDLSHSVSHAGVREGGSFRAVGRESGDHLSGVHRAPAGNVLWRLPGCGGGNAGEEDSSDELHFGRIWRLLMYVVRMEMDCKLKVLVDQTSEFG